MLNIVILSEISPEAASCPRFPDFRLISHRRLTPVSDNRKLQYGLILQNFFRPILLSNIPDQCQQILIPAFRIDHGIETADRAADGFQFSFGKTFLLHIHILKSDAALFEEALRLLGIPGFLRSENLYVHCIPFISVINAIGVIGIRLTDVIGVILLVFFYVNFQRFYN